MTQAVFVEGPIPRHVINMLKSSSIALMAVFAVDALDLFFLSLLGDTEIVAALGFAWPVMFFTLALALGLSASMTALVSRHLGAGEHDTAREFVLDIWIIGFLGATALGIVLWVYTPEVISLFGATGRTAELATAYLRINLICLPVFSISMTAGAVLRAIGDRHRAMAAKLAGAGTNAVLDPIFIFGFDWGIEGAAWASVIARFAILFVALYGVLSVHRMVSGFDLERLKSRTRTIVHIAAPVALAKAGAPVASAIVLAQFARFGDHAVAAYTMIERTLPFLFVVLFALPQSVSPIIGQNFGARLMHRIGESWQAALVIMSLYTILIWGLMWLSLPFFSDLFQATPETARLLELYFHWMLPFTFCLGLQFMAHATFNTIGFPFRATACDLAKDLLGIVPFSLMGASLAGVSGIFYGQALALVCFGILSALYARYTLRHSLNRQSPDATA